LLDAGIVVREMLNNPSLGMDVIGFVDDDPRKRRRGLPARRCEIIGCSTVGGGPRYRSGRSIPTAQAARRDRYVL
jgi:hypothetical protein